MTTRPPDGAARRADEGIYRSLFAHMLNGLAYCRMIFQDGRPEDFVYLKVNPRFAELSGLKDVEGRRVSEVIPGIRASDPKLFEIYGRVASTGRPEQFETYVAALKDWYLISVYCPQPDHFVAVFDVITARKQAETSLRESENRFRSLYEHSPLGIYRTTVDGRILMANPAIVRMLGYSSFAELSARNLEESGYAPDSPRRRFKELMERDGAVQGFESVWTAKDGRRIAVAEYATAVREADGGILYYEGTVEDITERKRAEQELLRSERSYREIFDATADAILLHDAVTGRILDVNEAMLRMYGFPSKAEVLEASLPALISGEPPYTMEEAQRHIRRAVAEGPEIFEWRARRQDGERFWVEVSLRSSTIGGEGRLLAVVRDISARKQAEQELREKEELLNEMSAMAHVGGWSFDPATGMGWWTDEVARIHGLDPRVPTSVAFGLGFYAPASRERIAAAVKAAVESGTPYDLELEFVTALGQPRWVRTIGVPHLQDGRVVQVRGALQDITVAKRQEQELERMNRLYRALSEINQNVVRAPSIDELFSVICRVLIEFGGFKLAWLGLVDPATREVKVAARHGDLSEYLDGLRIYADDRPEGRGITGLAIREARPVVVNDFLGDPITRPWAERAQRAGFRASASFPLRFQGEVCGALTVYAGEMNFFQPREVDLLQEAALDICFAWEKLHASEQRALIEKQLLESEERYRLLAENTEDFVSLSDIQGTFAYISPSYYRVTGWRPEEDRTADWNTRVHPDDLPLIRRARAANLAGEPTVIEHRIRCRDGSWIWVEARGKPIRGRAGGVEHLLLWSHDITRRKRAEEESSRLATIVEQSAESIVFTDLQSNIVYANPAFERVTGYRLAEVLGRNPRVLQSGAHDAAFYRQMWSVLSRGEVWRGHLINKRKDGSHFEEDATISPIRNPAGQRVGYAAIKRDITEELRLEAQFRRAQKMETIGHLAGGVAHDFNNLLQAILGYNEIIRNGTAADDPRRADMHEIDKAAGRAADLTRQLLALGRKQNLDRRVTDLHALIEDLSKMLRRVIGENIRIDFELAPALDRVLADHGQIAQILLNLAINARDAMPRGGRLVFATGNRTFTADDLAAQPDIRAGAFVCVSVSDTGTGISPEVLEKLFEPFFTTKESGQGTGLGLATSYGIARQHGGWIDVESSLGHGSSFRLYLPAIAHAEPPLEPPPSSDAATIHRGHGERILLVEDEAVIRDLIRRQIERMGYAVTCAATAGEALAEFSRCDGAFDLVLTDVVLPDRNGIELLEDLLARKPDLRVLISSGYTDNEKRWPVILERKWPFIGKPFAMAELRQALGRILPGD